MSSSLETWQYVAEEKDVLFGRKKKMEILVLVRLRLLLLLQESDGAEEVKRMSAANHVVSSTKKLTSTADPVVGAVVAALPGRPQTDLTQPTPPWPGLAWPGVGTLGQGTVADFALVGVIAQWPTLVATKGSRGVVVVAVAVAVALALVAVVVAPSLLTQKEALGIGFPSRSVKDKAKSGSGGDRPKRAVEGEKERKFLARKVTSKLSLNLSGQKLLTKLTGLKILFKKSYFFASLPVELLAYSRKNFADGIERHPKFTVAEVQLIDQFLEGSKEVKREVARRRFISKVKREEFLKMSPTGGFVFLSNWLLYSPGNLNLGSRRRTARLVPALSDCHTLKNSTAEEAMEIGSNSTQKGVLSEKVGFDSEKTPGLMKRFQDDCKFDLDSSIWLSLRHEELFK
ncbi:hypothetical protein RUM44_007325 [Polyplax serrata]|uniref:Uncharacterized protein n=1 Tax=Polyplax serrata TaxID=468196 RepID=A0ABR1B204_POLSC